MRALGQLGDMAADSYLVELLDRHQDDDLVENAIAALTMLGPRVPGLLMDYFNQPLTHPDSRSRAVEAIYLFARRQPDQQGHCVQMLTEALAGYQEQSTLLNGFIVYYLVKLGATEAAEMISQAFAAGKVEEDINGSWAAVQVALGLAEASDFTPNELRGAGDRALKEQRQVKSAQRAQRTETAQLSGSYSILDHLRR